MERERERDQERKRERDQEIERDREIERDQERERCSRYKTFLCMRHAVYIDVIFFGVKTHLKIVSVFKTSTADIYSLAFSVQCRYLIHTQ